MTQSIDKDRILAEIEKRMQELHPTNTHRMQVGEKVDRDVLMWLNALTWVKNLLNTLEVKDVQEEPVSEEFEKCASKIILEGTNFNKSWYAHPELAFKAGAKWKEQQMMSKAIVREVKVDAGGYPYIDATELYDYDKDMSLAKEGDKVKVIILKDE